MEMLATAASLLAQNPNVGGGFALGIPCVGGILALAALALFIWALVDAIQNTRLDGNAKLIWVIVILVLPLLGPILYLVIGRKS